MLPSIFVLAAIAISALPSFAAPLATSQVVRLPELATFTMGLVTPSEIPNPMRSSGPGGKNFGSTGPLDNMFESFGSSPHLRRQLRFYNHDIGGNMTDDSLVGSLVKRNRKGEAEDARLATMVAAAPTPAPRPAPGQLNASPVRFTGSAVDLVGASRENTSYAVHDALNAVLNPSAAAQSAASAVPAGTASADVTHETVNPDAGKKVPAGVGYVTDTMDTPHPKSSRRDFGVEGTMHARRHDLTLDTDALLPERPDPNVVGPKPAYENVGLIDLDSNQSPKLAPNFTLPANFTQASSNLTQTSTNVTQTSTKLASDPASDNKSAA
ncbi:hypothetical protein WOLCODRAFT_156852 [Wolfiporia cocos MD-104 SS10]|uniref:Uncharacterized protein n=1 Tax=Wolfiporia cocos (strain MD-104) TaxID=742152 RepID=A0A2H3JEL4_WOLCO|nr:hypothetical protein WOLCODRAFT_156852 [Wolfiporia cocos MD-104 SS10]